jgi:stringent starvation protein B
MTLINDNQGTSTRPYLLRALHEWCTDNGFTPYIAVHVDDTVHVPMEHVKNNEIVLNVGFDATSGLKLGNEVVEFRARFGGVSRDITVPIDHVVAIYARENGQGMAFPVPTPDSVRNGGQTGGEQAPAPPKGLRLATVPAAAGANADGAAEPAATAPTEPVGGPGPGANADAGPDTDGPPPPKAPRPSLKRIK